MPLSALDAAGQILDATLPDLGGSRPWQSIHRVRPRAELTCPACGAAMHAKQTRRLRFFAHDAETSDCPLTGESLDHQLLKVALASAARDSGWTAALEVAGEGWRADVLATSPDRGRRVALEAQLSQLTVEDIQRRTATMKADGVDSVWITPNNPPWLCHVPSARVQADVDGSGFVVVGGVGMFDSRMCRDAAACDVDVEVIEEFGLSGPWWGDRAERAVGPCPGHGRWQPPATPVTLTKLVKAVLHGQCVLVSARLPAPTWREEAHGSTVWSTPEYLRLAEAEAAAGAARRRWDERRDAEAAKHAANTQALLDRQQALVRPVVDDIHRREGTLPWLKEKNKRTPEWAMGVPVWVNRRPYAVICPVASRIKEATRLHPGLIIYAGTQAEADRLARAGHPTQRIVVLEPEPPAPPVVAAGAGRAAPRPPTTAATQHRPQERQGAPR